MTIGTATVARTKVPGAGRHGEQVAEEEVEHGQGREDGDQIIRASWCLVGGGSGAALWWGPDVGHGCPICILVGLLAEA